MAPRQHAPTRRTRSGAPRPGRGRVRAPIGSGQRRELVRNRLIESRLTPNAISLTGLALNVLAAVLVWERLFFLGGLAFIVGSIMDTLDGRYSRMSGKGTPFGAFLDSTLDRIEEGIVLTAVAGYFALHGNRAAAAGVAPGALRAASPPKNDRIDCGGREARSRAAVITSSEIDAATETLERAPFSSRAMRSRSDGSSGRICASCR